MANKLSFVVKSGTKERKVNMDFVELLIIGEILKWDAKRMNSLGIEQVEARKQILEEIFGRKAPFDSSEKPVRVFIDLGTRLEPISHSLLYTYFVAKRTNWKSAKMKKYDADLEYYGPLMDSYGLLPPEMKSKIQSEEIQNHKAKKRAYKQIAYEMKKAQREAEEKKRAEAQELAKLAKIAEAEKKKNPQAKMQIMTSAGESDMALVQSDLMTIAKNEKLPRFARKEAEYALTELITAQHKAEPMKRAVEIIRRVKERYG